jgi:phage shock protein PspC (stress-responsive transcriptional regulator)
VCGGIAETYGADPTAVRLLAAILGIFTGIVPMLILYLVAAVIIPEPATGDGPTAPAARSRIEPGQGALIFGIVLIVAGLAALANEVFHIDWELLWPAAFVGFGGLIVLLAVRKESV